MKQFAFLSDGSDLPAGAMPQFGFIIEEESVPAPPVCKHVLIGIDYRPVPVDVCYDVP